MFTQVIPYEPGARTEGGGRWHGGLASDAPGSAPLACFDFRCAVYLALPPLVYLFVHFLLTEASVNDIVVLNSTLGTLLGPCFGLFPFESEPSCLVHCWGAEASTVGAGSPDLGTLGDVATGGPG